MWASDAVVGSRGRGQQDFGTSIAGTRRLAERPISALIISPLLSLFIASILAMDGFAGPPHLRV